MKNLIYVFFALTLGLAVASCGKEYDDTELKGKVDKLTEEVNTLKANQQAMQAVIDVWKTGGYVQSIDNSVPGQHTITFYGENGKVVVIYDGTNGQAGAQGPQGPQGPEGPQGAAGDSFFKSVVTTEDGVTFTLSDETSFTIPFAKAFKLVIDNPEAMVEAGVPVEFPYTVKNANATTSVDVFAGGNYAANVNAGASKIVVTPPTPAVDGNVLAWAQNDEGLFSMVKLKFLVTADTQIVTEPEVYQAIPKAGGDVVLDVVSNVDIIVPSPDVDWVTVSLTKASYKLTLTVTENTTGEPRELVMKILRADNNEQVQEFKIIQVATAPAQKVTKVEKLWEKISTEGAAWNSYYGGTAGTDRNVAIDGKYVYLAEFGSSKKIWAIEIANPENVTAVANTTIKSEGFDGSIFLSCPRVVKKNNGDPILIVSNLSTGAYGWLYAYEEGITAEPKAIKLNQYDAGRRLGDTFTTWGNYENLVMIFGSHNGNGFVTFQLPPNAGNVSGLWSRFALDLGGMPAYYPFPDNIAKGIYAVRGEARDQFATVADITNDNVRTTEGAHAVTAKKLNYSAGMNGSAAGYNFVEFNGKRYVIYGKETMNTKNGQLLVREGELTTPWETILGVDTVDADYTTAFYTDSFTGGMASSNSAVDVAIWQTANEIFIALDKQKAGLAVYRMYAE